MPERENIMGAHLFYMLANKKKAAEFNNVMNNPHSNIKTMNNTKKKKC